MLASRKADAIPILAGPITEPTIAHVIFGMYTRSGCSDIRSMYDILRSCLFTIAACVYRAVHPNVPCPEYGFWGRVGVTIKIVFCALVAPEMIIFWALRQWFGAKKVARVVNEAIERRKPNPGFKWTQTHGQFMQMGGFARKGNPDDLYLDDLVRFNNDGHIDVEDLRLTEKEINDKSKGDILSKLLVLFQTTWFVFECMTRLHQGLPLLEIEVVTLAFATLNAITYGLWWYKPLNVLCPINIPIQYERHISPPTADDAAAQAPSPGDLTTSGHEQGIAAAVWNAVKAIAAIIWGMMKSITGAVGDGVKGVVKKFDEDVDEYGRWWTAAIWIIVYPFLAVRRLVIMPLGYLLTGEDSFYVVPNHEVMQLAWSLAAFVGTIFGAIHFLSWNSTFPTHIQLVLWRASSVVLVIQPVLMLVAILLGTAKDEAPKGSWIRYLGKRFANFFLFLSLGGTVLYILARFCVLVLAFLTLRDLPPPAFVNVSWTSYIPHF